MKFYDGWKIMAGVMVFVALITFPLWYAGGKAMTPPVLSLDTPVIGQLEKKRCVEDTPYMRTNHMKLLGAWRDRVVREGDRLYTAKNGLVHEMSLSGTCLQCHSNKEQFCDRCHNYVGAKPSCWNCHIIPGEVK